ncbi:MAG: ATP-binding protein [Ruminococcus flavefaciens]|nr:ATP-binding protein [Ruminococcus flavefaciens]
MIQELKIKNFLSFRDEAKLSFEATKDTDFEDYQVVEVAPKVRLLRFGIIFGANASGKSNTLKAFDFLKSFWFADAQSLDAPTGSIPFLLDKETPGQPSEFELKFFVDGVRYWYLLKLTKTHVIEEKLYYYKSVQPTLLFHRFFENGQSVIKFNTAAVKTSPAAQEELTLKCLPNISFFAARNKVNVSLNPIDTARDWMKYMVLHNIGPQMDLFEYARQRMMDSKPLKAHLLNFVHRADFNISDIRSDKIEMPLPPHVLNMILEEDSLIISPEEKEHIKTSGAIPQLKTLFRHVVTNARGKESYDLPNNLQSEGTQRTLGIEAAIFDMTERNAFLPIDELEASLHPDLVECIIEGFLKSKNQGQLLVTTHYDPLLNTINDLLRKDSVWFTEKDESGNTSLYSLSDFNGLNKISSFQRSYRNGVFGALPNIK